MLTPNPRFLALPLIALVVITALGLQAPRGAVNVNEASAAPALQLAHAAKNTLVRWAMMQAIAALQRNMEMMTVYVMGAILASLVFTALISADEQVEAD